MVKDANDSIADLLQAQISNQGVGVVSVSDGTVLCFTAAVLSKLLADALGHEKKQAVVFVKHQRPA